MPDNNNSTFTFRLQSDNGQHDLSNTIQHWDESRMYEEKQINAIESTNKKSLNQPTSIPSPFARIALVKTAFSEVARFGENALTAYQKIVSDSLDVAEIFFTFDKWLDKVEIITWKYGCRDNSSDLEEDSDLKKLQNTHRQFFKTLKTFLENDAVAYNFDKMKAIYILKYKKTGVMIGATSPSTLFFSSANIYNDIDIKLNSKRKAFEGIVSLHQRNWEFQKYLYSWIEEYKENRNFEGKDISIFNEFINYLDSQKPLINRIEEIDALKSVDKAIYTQFRAPDVEVLGKPLFKCSELSPETWSARDILEDVLIKLPFKINIESFFDGNLPNNSKNTFLLPIKEKFFSKYSIDDLKNFIKINHSGDVAEVEIKLDVQPAPIKRTYRKSENTLLELNFDCALFPNVRFSNESLANYRFGLVCNFKEKDKFSVELFKINGFSEKVIRRSSVRNETHNLNYQLKNYSIEGSNFDYIRISYNGFNGIVIPRLEPKNGDIEFTFAVDFGTTNTHIEYRKKNEYEIRTFDISKGVIDEKQVSWLHGGEDYMKEVFDEEYIPLYTDDEFKFPMRTALSYGEKTNWNDVYPFEKASFNELYEKRKDYDYNTTETNLKWSDGENYKKQVEVYIKSLMFLIRNKVILLNGKLENTKIIWFYPVSMEKNRYNNLKEVWNSAYQKYFGGNENNILPVTESVAPFKYYVGDRDAKNLVTIDIGGGTTDIVISETGSVDYITSFRFAANAIFGIGYAENNRVKNGIIRQFFYQIKSELQSVINNNDVLFRIFDEMFTNKSSEDIASFLFSLKQNKKVKLAGLALAENANLSKKLIDDTTQKITFIFFYAAIIYHLAKLMKIKNIKMPDKIIFSGNGSRVIQFFTDDHDTLKGFTKLIFEKVYGEKYSSSDLSIIRNKENPKEATCKGGFFIETVESYKDILKKKVILHSNGTDTIIHRIATDHEDTKETDIYKYIDSKYLEQTVLEVEEFIKLVFDSLKFFSKEGYKLNQNSIEIARKVCFQKLDIYAENGFRLKMKEVDENDIIEETLFFYPLIGMLKDLSSAICDDNIKN